MWTHPASDRDRHGIHLTTDVAAPRLGHTGVMPQIWEQRGPSRRQLAFDVGCALAFAAFPGLLYLRLGTTDFLVVLALAVALAARRLSIRVMVAFGFLAAVIQLAVPGWHAQLSIADVAYAALFFVLGAHPEAVIRRFGAVTGLVGLTALAAWAALGDTGPIGAQGRLFYSTALTAMAAVVCGGGWIVGYLRLQRRLAIQAEFDAQVEEVERRRLADQYAHAAQRSRIATDMHDIVAHSWAVVAAQADGARYALRDSPAETEQALEVIADTARSTIADLRTILAELRDGDAERPIPGHEQQHRLIERMRLTGMDIQHQLVGARDGSSLLALTAHRLLSEALTNALKHGDLTRPVRVDQDWTDGYRLRVVNLIGQRGEGTGHGVVGMMERAALAGGRLRAGAHGAEWTVEAVIPDPGRSRTSETIVITKESAHP